MFLDETGLSEPFQIGGRTVGLIKNGVFTSLATDMRGSVIAETTGEARLASPFGQRDVHPAMAAALDYVEKGWDADLGLVRMGVRDYDPAVNQFTTADPLFLEKPDLCLKNPVECNLYSYAAGDPVGKRDPTGTVVDTVLDVAFMAFDVASMVYHAATHNDAALKVDKLALAADVICFVAPFATGGGAVVRAEQAGVKLFFAGEKRTIQATIKAEQTAARSQSAETRVANPKGARLEPADIWEHLAMEEARAGAGAVYRGKLDDRKYDPSIGTHTKMQHSVAHPDGTKTEIHYDVDRVTGERSGFKIKDDTNAASRGHLYPQLGTGRE